MTRVAIFLRRWWAVLAAVAAGTAAVLWYWLRPSAPQPLARIRLDIARNRSEDRIAVANARAAVEIAVLRGRDAEGKRLLEEVLADPDEERRQNALVDMARRIREGGR